MVINIMWKEIKQENKKYSWCAKEEKGNSKVTLGLVGLYKNSGFYPE